MATVPPALAELVGKELRRRYPQGGPEAEQQILAMMNDPQALNAFAQEAEQGQLMSGGHQLAQLGLAGLSMAPLAMSGPVGWGLGAAGALGLGGYGAANIMQASERQRHGLPNTGALVGGEGFGQSGWGALDALLTPLGMGGASKAFGRGAQAAARTHATGPNSWGAASRPRPGPSTTGGGFGPDPSTWGASAQQRAWYETATNVGADEATRARAAKDLIDSMSPEQMAAAQAAVERGSDARALNPNFQSPDPATWYGRSRPFAYLWPRGMGGQEIPDYRVLGAQPPRPTPHPPGMGTEGPFSPGLAYGSERQPINSLTRPLSVGTRTAAPQATGDISQYGTSIPGKGDTRSAQEIALQTSPSREAILENIKRRVPYIDGTDSVRGMSGFGSTPDTLQGARALETQEGLLRNLQTASMAGRAADVAARLNDVDAAKIVREVLGAGENVSMERLQEALNILATRNVEELVPHMVGQHDETVQMLTKQLETATEEQRLRTHGGTGRIPHDRSNIPLDKQNIRPVAEPASYFSDRGHWEALKTGEDEWTAFDALSRERAGELGGAGEHINITKGTMQVLLETLQTPNVSPVGPGVGIFPGSPPLAPGTGSKSLTNLHNPIHEAIEGDTAFTQSERIIEILDDFMYNTPGVREALPHSFKQEVHNAALPLDKLYERSRGIRNRGESFREQNFKGISEAELENVVARVLQGDNSAKEGLAQRLKFGDYEELSSEMGGRVFVWDDKYQGLNPIDEYINIQEELEASLQVLDGATDGFYKVLNKWGSELIEDSDQARKWINEGAQQLAKTVFTEAGT
jgi:hypothetical protein